VVVDFHSTRLLMMGSAVAKNAIRLTGKPQRMCGNAIVGVFEKFTELEDPGFEQLQL
jgi:hypothetical protein